MKSRACFIQLRDECFWWFRFIWSRHEQYPDPPPHRINKNQIFMMQFAITTFAWLWVYSRPPSVVWTVKYGRMADTYDMRTTSNDHIPILLANEFNLKRKFVVIIQWIKCQSAYSLRARETSRAWRRTSFKLLLKWYVLCRSESVNECWQLYIRNCVIQMIHVTNNWRCLSFCCSIKWSHRDR